MASKDYNIVLDFWFGKSTDTDYLQKKSFWYSDSQSDDELVEKHLGHYYYMAKDGQLDHWADLGEGEGALALILLLDQASRNIYRNKPEAFMTDPKAINIAKYALNRGWDKNMIPIFRRYMYSPLHHSESLEDQELSLKLFTDLGLPIHLDYAKKYFALIKEFGRFPHRDQVLGRNN